MIRTYLDWVLDIPWARTTDDRLDPIEARRVLDEDHYDLDKVKERIVEYLAVQKLRQSQGEKPAAAPAPDAAARPATVARIRGPILCFVGPPGVGKTSLGQSIARAMNRKFVRISLGGVRDEAEIRGHRRTYIGSMPGRLVQALKTAGSANPVLMLDEIDKVTVGIQGDPAAALLEVLDPAQNHAFRDHYMEIPIDLSRVLFIATANQLGTIHPALLDRMELISLSGYTEEEKVHIARLYLVPRQLEENGLEPAQIEITDDALRRVITEYTREAGVRTLERQIGTIARKVAARVASDPAYTATVDSRELDEYLGPARFRSETAFRTSRPGVATGAAWTEAGGDVLFIEASLMPGNGNLTLTGQLGNVMQESARAALSHIRQQAADLGIPPDFLAKQDLHIHVPAGAIPKDGPSAGVTMVTAIASLLTGRAVKSTIGMTGEVTLQGRVLPIGGLKQKVLAAHAAGLTEVIVPERNAADLDDVPREVRDHMTFHIVATVDEVLQRALEPSALAIAA
jgi:ATP-dependent Lon protease